MKQLFLGLLLGISFLSNAQKVDKEVLFSINDKPYYTDEFIRVYNKNLDLVKDESQKDLNQYLDLYIGYKLKVNKAYKLGLQDGKQYQSELKNYRTQLSKNYTTDSKVTKELVDEAYLRSQKEVKASHILILVDENAAPEDTLVAYKKIMDIRQRFANGEDFGTVATEVSQDPSAKDNKGDLGYFSAFRMVYPFETAAFNTPIGSISKPVRSRFGYHLIKVTDVRPNRGEISVAHIMILNPKDDADKEKAKNTINDIYKKLQQGEKFEDLAKQFSEDKSSATKGGVLNRFASGQLSSQEFEDVAFGLTKENPVSQPFQSQYGWHIVKLIDKFPIKSLEESQKELENKISKDDRSRLIANSLTEKLRKKYPIKKNNKMYAAVEKTVTNDYYDGKWKLPEDVKPYQGELFSFEKNKISGESFLNYIEKQQKAGTIKTKPVQKLVENLYNKYTDEQINQYYDDNLEKEFPDFANVMDEYRDGLLLFDLMDKEIWQRSKNDSVGLKAYYDKNINKYYWKDRVEATILSSTKMDNVKKALAMLNDNKTIKEIKEKLNTKEVVNIMAYDGTFEEGSEQLPKGTKMQEGISEITKQGEYYYVTKITKILPAAAKLFEDCKGKVINDYQQYLEQNWVDELKKEFAVKVNKDVFEKVKSKIKK